MAWKRTAVPRSMYRRQLATRLKALREAGDMTLADVAARVEVNQGSLSRIENGDRGVTPVLVKALLDCYGVHDPAEREDVLDLVRADKAHQKPWWRKHSAVINTTQYGGYLALESSALYLRSYEPLLMPGLLQTADYAREIITRMRTDLTPKQVGELVDVRMGRQEKFRESGGARLWVVIDEAAVRRRIGSPVVMSGQLTRLLETQDDPTTTVQLLPFESGAHAGLYGPFVLMAFPEPNPDVVWVESLTNSVYFDAPADVERYAEVFDHLRATALGPVETHERIHKVIEELQQ